MRASRAFSILGLAAVVIMLLAIVAGMVVTAVQVVAALRAQVAPFLSSPAYPMTWGELLLILLVLVVVLGARR